MRKYPIVMSLITFAFVGCGEPHSDRSLTSNVRDAMADLPYDYRLLPELRSDDYVVFSVSNPRKYVDVTIAFGLPSKRHLCSKPPRPFADHPKSVHHFSGAAARPLICFAADIWQAAGSREAAIISGNMERQAAVALCEQVYDEWACFD